MSEQPAPVAVGEQAELDPTKAAALAWLEAAATHAAEREAHFRRESDRALGINGNWSRPGPVPAGFNGTEIDRQILQAEGSYDEDEEPTPDQEAASDAAEERSRYYADAAEYFALAKLEVTDDAFDLGQEASLAELEAKRQEEIAAERPDLIGQQVDEFETSAQLRFADEIAAIHDSRWYRDQDSTDHYAH